MPTQAPTTSQTTGTAVKKTLGMALGLALILVLLLIVFIMPSLKGGPKDLKLGVVAEQQIAESIETSLSEAAPGAFDIILMDSPEQLYADVENRELNGGFVVTEDGLENVIASAGSASISGTITGTATNLGKSLGLEVSTNDVVPLPAKDSTGIGIGGLAFPLVFGGIVPAAAFMKVFPRSLTGRAIGAGITAILCGIVVATMLMFVFGSIEHSFWPVAGAMALGIAALAIPLLGLNALFGGKGFTLGAMSMMFLGNPFAGISTTAAWLPGGLGLFGQLLPPGATGTFVRSAAYFGGTGGGFAALTLCIWLAAGIAMLVIAHIRNPIGQQEQTDATEATEPDAVPVLV